LAARGYAAASARDEARSRLEVARRRLENARQQSAALATTASAADAGVYLGDGYNDQPYSEQRLTELAVEENRAATALEVAQANA
ncbi:hypothetical protein J8J27_31670, partial [Mycobacterium tuberculosis]|nr:hypothetical protein [Mycobacterium tuberculosis]